MIPARAPRGRPPGHAPRPRPPLRFLLASVVAASFACDGGGTDHDAVQAEIEEVTRRWERSLVAGDPAGAVPDVFTEDAVRLPAGEPPVEGRPAIAAALAGSVALAEARFHIEELETEGGFAWARGTYAVRAPDGQSFTGKFLEVWRRTPAGWRIHRVMWD